MAVTSSLVKELRELTGVGMMDCKKALTDTDGDVEKAVELLRERGLAVAQKKAGRLAAEGLVHSYVTEDNKIGSVVEVNSETDFVAKNQEFRSFVEQVAKQAAITTAADVETFLQDKWMLDESKTIKDALVEKIGVIGENLSVRRFVKFEKEQNGALVTYIHGEGKIVVMIDMVSDNTGDLLVEAGKNLAMQIAALSAKYVNRSEVPADFIEKEREILKAAALNEGKPANVVDKMVEGRLTKSLKDICLLDQEYVKDADINVATYLENVGKELGSTVTVKRFIRFETGEGLEKKQEDFAAEVSKVVQG